MRLNRALFVVLGLVSVAVATRLPELVHSPLFVDAFGAPPPWLAHALAPFAALGSVGLAMACPTNLSAALRSVHPCAARPPARSGWVIADRVSASRSRTGMQVLVDLDGVPVQDTLGRRAHVRGIYLQSWLEYTTAAANDVVTAYQLRSFFNTIVLEDVTGHQYLTSLDARDLLDDVFIRHGRHVQNPVLTTGTEAQGNPATAPNTWPSQTVDLGITLNEGAGTRRRRVSWYWPTVTLNSKGNKNYGLIPLELLQKKGTGAAFRFNVASALPQAPTGITFAGNGDVLFLEQSAGAGGCNIWLDVVYLPQNVQDARYQLRGYTNAQASGMALNPERTTEYFVVRYKPEDAATQAGQDVAQQLSRLTLRCAGFTLIAGLTALELAQRTMFFFLGEDGANARHQASEDLPLFDSSGNQQIQVLVPYRPFRAAQPAGVLNFDYADRGTATFERFLHRTVLCHDEAFGEKLAEQLDGCSPAAKVQGTDSLGSVLNDRVESFEPMIITPNKAA